VATPDFLPGRADFLIAGARERTARKTASGLHFSGVYFTNFTHSLDRKSRPEGET
jgi:hypothetical protein